jgi:hypothetical protein
MKLNQRNRLLNFSALLAAHSMMMMVIQSRGVDGMVSVPHIQWLTLITGPPGDIYSITTLFPHSLKASEIPKSDRVKSTAPKKKSKKTRYLFQRWSQVQKLTQVNNNEGQASTG